MKKIVNCVYYTLMVALISTIIVILAIGLNANLIY